MIRPTVTIAIIDLYNHERNEGIRCINELLYEAQTRFAEQLNVQIHSYESRYSGNVPSINDYDIFVSSGGPGSPFEDQGREWETKYFHLLDNIYNTNQNGNRKKYIFFICHSFQIMARHFKFAEVNERFKKSFGIWRFRKTDDGKNDELLNGLSDPFYAADFRQFQVVHPDMQRMNELGAKILSMEMEHQDGHPSAIMAARISDEIAGTQFHPEADADSMLYHFRQQERKDFLINQFGESKYDEMMGYLNDPATIRLTRDTVIPAFLNNALNKLAESFN